MDVSTNRGTPKWMVYNGKPYEQMDDLGVPLFLETPTYSQLLFLTLFRRCPISCVYTRKKKGIKNGNHLDALPETNNEFTLGLPPTQ